MNQVGIGRVHTDDGTRFHIGASATDEAFIDVFATAAEAGRPIRVHAPTFERVHHIEALAGGYGYQVAWSFPPAVGWASLTVIDPDTMPQVEL